MAISRNHFLAALRPATQTVTVEGLSEPVTIRKLTVARHQAVLRYARQANGEIDNGRMIIGLLIHGLVEPELTDADAEALGELDIKTAERLAMAILEFSGLTPDQVKETKKDFS